jgi:hypothetical protein
MLNTSCKREREEKDKYRLDGKKTKQTCFERLMREGGTLTTTPFSNYEGEHRMVEWGKTRKNRREKSVKRIRGLKKD